VSKPGSKRDKKRAEIPEQPVDNDLLTAKPAPQVSVLTSGKAALPADVDEAPSVSPAVSEAPNQKQTQEEMNQENPSGTEQNAPNKTRSAGGLLKEAREAAGLSIDDVSHLLKLAPRQVLALEQQDFAALPPRAFVRGFMRNYARLLNIDADAVLEALPPECPQALSPAATSIKLATHSMPVLPPYGEKATRPQTWKWLSAAAILAVIATVFFFWPKISLLLSEEETTPVATEEVSAPPVWQETDNLHTITPIIAPLSEVETAAESPTAVAAPASEETELVLRFRGDSWVEVRDKHDRILYTALEKSGSEKKVPGTPPFSLVLGNSEAVTVTLRGKTIDLSSQSRQGVARLVIE